MFRISGFYDDGVGDLKGQLALMKRLGGKNLCPRGVNGKNIAAFSVGEFENEVLPLLKEAEISLSSLGSPIGKVGINDEEGFAAQLKKLEQLVQIAKLTDCKYIRCFSFFTGGDFS